MTKTIVFNNEITIETMDALINELSLAENGIDDNGNCIFENIILYFSTIGGDVSAAEMLVDYINNMQIPILVKFFSNCFSSGFNIALGLNVDIEILPTTIAMVHLADTGLSYRDLKDKNSFSKWCQEYLLKKDDENCIKLYKMSGLTDKEIDIIKNGGDVWMDSDRLIECINTYRNSLELNQIDEELSIVEENKKSLVERRNFLNSLLNKNKKSGKNGQKKQHLQRHNNNRE